MCMLFVRYVSKLYFTYRNPVSYSRVDVVCFLLNIYIISIPIILHVMFVVFVYTLLMTLY